MGKKGRSKAKKLAADFKHGCEKRCEKGMQLIESCLGINKAEKGHPYVPTTTRKKAEDIKQKPEPTVQEAVRHQEQKPKPTVDPEIDPGEEWRRSYKVTKTRSTSTQSLPTFGLQENNVNGVSGQAITRSSSASGTHLGDAHHGDKIDIKQFIQKDPVETPRPLEIKGDQKTELCWCKWLKRGIFLALLFVMKSTLVAFSFCFALAIAIVVFLAISYAITEFDVIKGSLQWILIAILIIIILEAYIVYSFHCVVKDVFKSSNDA